MDSDRSGGRVREEQGGRLKRRPVVRGLPPLPGCGTACSCVDCLATNGFFGTQVQTLVPHRNSRRKR